MIYATLESQALGVKHQWLSPCETFLTYHNMAVVINRGDLNASLPIDRACTRSMETLTITTNLESDSLDESFDD